MYLSVCLFVFLSVCLSVCLRNNHERQLTPVQARFTKNGPELQNLIVLGAIDIDIQCLIWLNSQSFIIPGMPARVNTHPPDQIHNSHENASSTLTASRLLMFHGLHPLEVLTYLDRFMVRLFYSLKTLYVYWSRQPRVFWLSTSLFFCCYFASIHHTQTRKYIHIYIYTWWHSMIYWYLISVYIISSFLNFPK